ncbi:MAG: NfeD family protein [Gammaproteobacteria bacterium]|jgi:inner membrane protein
MDILYWHWLALGFALLILEMLLPTGFVLLWVGVAAVVVGAVTWLVPGLGWAVEFTLWGGLSVASILLWRAKRQPLAPSDQPQLNRRGESYVGRTFTLTEPLVNGIGKLRVDDSQWRISGPDAPAGSQVRVVAADGATLRVERA